MTGLFAFLFLLSLIGLIVGLVRPAIFKRIFKKRTNRKTVGLSFGALIILFVVLINVTGQSNSDAVKSKAYKVSSGGTTPGTSQKASVYANPQWAGYLKNGPSNSMTSVSGQWTVPSIIGASSSSQVYKLSGAWIGIGGWATGGLIQIGTNQDEGPNTGPSGTLYFAFWECPTEIQHIIPSINVKPGDEVQGSITKQGSNWSLALADKTSGESFQDSVACNADQSTAEWVLEDQTPPGDKSGNLPSISNVTFSNLTVNGKAPGHGSEIKLLMTSAGQTIADPGELSPDSQAFTLTDTRK